MIELLSFLSLALLNYRVVDEHDESRELEEEHEDERDEEGLPELLQLHDGDALGALRRHVALHLVQLAGQRWKKRGRWKDNM